MGCHLNPEPARQVQPPRLGRAIPDRIRTLRELPACELILAVAAEQGCSASAKPLSEHRRVEQAEIIAPPGIRLAHGVVRSLGHKLSRCSPQGGRIDKTAGGTGAHPFDDGHEIRANRCPCA